MKSKVVFQEELVAGGLRPKKMAVEVEVERYQATLVRVTDPDRGEVPLHELSDLEVAWLELRALSNGGADEPPVA